MEYVGDDCIIGVGREKWKSVDYIWQNKNCGYISRHIEPHQHVDLWTNINKLMGEVELRENFRLKQIQNPTRLDPIRSGSIS